MSEEQLETFAESLARTVGFSGEAATIETRLSEAPALESLADLPAGTPVWIRADLDVADRDGVIGDDPRLASLSETLAFGRSKGWRMLLIGHRGRNADQTLEYVFMRLRELEPGAGPFVKNWFDEHAQALTGIATKAVDSLEPGQWLMMENLRSYGFERRLWRCTEEEFPSTADQLARVATAMREGATVLVHEAIAAGNKDFSCTALPLVMGRVALGAFSRRELAEHVIRARDAGLIMFSGMKLDKLNQLRAIVARGDVELILTGGSLAMALRKAQGERSGNTLSIGAAGDPEKRDSKAYVPPSAIHNAHQLLEDADKNDVRIVTPIDFVLDDGTVANDIPPDAWQCDIGPDTRVLYDEQARAWAKTTKRRAAFYNGVMGKFEDRTFAGGTEALVGTLKSLQQDGISVYVGGGEGRAALERYGAIGDVAHAFTAGGTILKCLAGRPLPFLESLAAQARSHPSS